MRTVKSFKNINASMLKFFFSIISKFAVRTVLLYTLGEAYIGISSLFASILGLLSLAELGFGNAVIYSLFKPVAENDTVRINALMNFYRKTYLIISGAVLAVGVALMPFLGSFIKDAPENLVNLNVIYLMYIFNVVVSYTFSYNRALLYANQRNDIEAILSLIVQTIYGALQVLVLLLTRNFYVFTLLYPIFTLLENVAITIKVKKTFPQIKARGKIDLQLKKEISKNVLGLLCHRVSGIVIVSADSIIISAFISISILGRYNNYMLPISSIQSMLQMIVIALGSSIGNSVAEKSREENHVIFKKLSYIYFGALIFCSSCLVALLQPLSTLWLKGDEVLNLATIICMVISFYFTMSRYLLGTYKEKAGIILKGAYVSIIEAIVKLVLSLILVHYLGIMGIILGTIISSICVVVILETYIFYKHYLKVSPKGYYLQYIFFILVAAIVGMAAYFGVVYIPSSIPWFILQVFIAVLISGFGFVAFTFWMPQFKESLRTLKAIMQTRKTKLTKESVEETTVS